MFVVGHLAMSHKFQIPTRLVSTNIYFDQVPRVSGFAFCAEQLDYFGLVAPNQIQLQAECFMLKNV